VLSTFVLKIRQFALECRLRLFAWQRPSVLHAEIAEQVAASRALLPALAKPAHPAQVLVDISTIIQHDAGTGIQRVVRALADELSGLPLAHHRITFVYATKWRGFRYARWQTGTRPERTTDAVTVTAGDIFLGLDLTAHILPHRCVQLARWKMRGARLAFVVYDLLPAERPDWFTRKGARAHTRWLTLLAIYADDVLCISHAVAGAYARWHARHAGPPRTNMDAKDVHIASFPLGSNFASDSLHDSSSVQPALLNSALQAAIGDREFILMVGTVEPRKGYDQVLDAFKKCWATGANIALVLVGRRGWKVEHLAQRIAEFSQHDDRLIWIQDCDDNQLAALYQRTSGLLAASYAEGFGLPIVEAARYGVPILARDLAVFREVAQAGATFFSAENADQLADAILKWTTSLRDGTAAKPEGVPVMAWRDSARALCQVLAIEVKS
jgi:glycosyltransferase involved in cell wall biosynthesis